MVIMPIVRIRVQTTGRGTSILVDEEAYLFQLVRYVHNNPVRAGVVAKPADSAWTSHREYLGRESCPTWLKNHKENEARMRFNLQLEKEA